MNNQGNRKKLETKERREMKIGKFEKKKASSLYNTMMIWFTKQHLNTIVLDSRQARVGNSY